MFLFKDDSSRVELTPLADTPGSDYINASFINVIIIMVLILNYYIIQGYKRSKAYIAAQGNVH